MTTASFVRRRDVQKVTVVPGHKGGFLALQRQMDVSADYRSHYLIKAKILLDRSLECKYEKQMFADLPMAPPPGFRKGIPVTVKLQVVIRQYSLCAKCSKRLEKLEDTEFDHVPAIQLRSWDPVAKDTTPGSNDPDYIFAKHVDCHAEKTFGSKTSKRGADVTEIARTKSIAKKTEAFRRRMLAKGDPENTPTERHPTRRKKEWPKRPFAKRPKNGKSRSRGEEGSSAA